MKNLLLSICCLFFVQMSFAQVNAVQRGSIMRGILKARETGASIDTTFLSEFQPETDATEKAIVSIQKTDMKRGITLTYFHLKTKKPINIIKFKPVAHHDDVVFLFANNFSINNDNRHFNAEIPDTTQTVVSHNGRVVNVIDLNTEKKQAKIEYLIEKGEVRVRTTYFYANGQAYYQNIGVLSGNVNNNFQIENPYYLYNSEDAQRFYRQTMQNFTDRQGMRNGQYRAKQEIEETFFYPNGKKYIYLKKVYNDKIHNALNAIINIWDSQGNPLKGSDYLNIKTQEARGVWYCFDVNGRKVDSTDFSRYPNANYKQDNIHKYPSEKDTIIGKMRTIHFYAYQKNYIGFAPAADFFAKATEKPKFVAVEDYKYQHYNLGRSINTPLFTLLYNEKGVLQRANINNNEHSFNIKSCPVEQPFTVEGVYKDSMPEGLFSIYTTDKSGKKADILLQAYFKNGVLSGECIGFRYNGKTAKRDTLYHSFFENGRVKKDKYIDNYTQKNKAKQAIADSTTALMEVEKLAHKKGVAEQHALYKAGKSKVWQSDSFTVYSYENSGYNNSTEQIKNIYTIKIVQNDSTPNTKVKVWIRNTRMKKEAFSVFSFYKKTLDLDSIADIKIGSSYADMRIDLAKKMVETYSSEKNRTEIVNDSVIIYTDLSTAYDDTDRIRNTKTDTICTYCAYPKGISNKIKTNMKVRESLAETLLTSFEFGKNYFNLEDPLFDINIEVPPIKQRTTCLYDANGGKYECKSNRFDLLYLPNGSIDTTIHKTKDGKWTGLVHLKNQNEEVTANYDTQGRKHGLSVTEQLNHAGIVYNIITETFDRDTLRSFNHFVEQGGYMLFEKKCKDKYCKNYVFSNYASPLHKKEQQEYDLFVENDTLKMLNVYYYENKQRAGLSYTLKAENDTTFSYASWHKNGNMRHKKANIDSRFNSYIPNFRKQLEAPNSRLDYLESFFPHHFEYHDNGKLARQCGMQRFDNLEEARQLYNNAGEYLRVFCEYYDDGRIKNEVLTDKIAFSYPSADNEAECAWESLPIQTGKFADGHRVGQWQGFQRNSAKQLLYEINYDEKGILQGKFRIYTPEGKLHLAAYFDKGYVKDSVIRYAEDGDMVSKYKNGKITSIDCYSKDENAAIALNRTYFFENGNLISELYYGNDGQTFENEFKMGDVMRSTTFYPNSKTRMEVREFGWDGGEQTLAKLTEYYKNGKIKFIDDKPNNTQTKIDTNGVAQTTFNIEGLSIVKNKKDIAKHWQRTQIASAPEPKYAQAQEYAGIARISKTLRIDCHFAKSNIMLSDIDDEFLKRVESNASFDKFTISDKKGGVLRIACTAKAPLKASIAYNEGELSAEEAQTKLRLYENDGSDLAIATKYLTYEPVAKDKRNLFSSLRLQNHYQVPASLAFNPRLVHRVLEPKNGNFDFYFNEIMFEKTSPTYYIQEDSLNKMQENASLPELENYIKKIRFCEKEAFVANNLHLIDNFEYEIGKTKMRFILQSFKIVNTLPYISDMVDKKYIKKIARIPSHPTADDAFLNDGSLRIFAQDGYFFLPFAPEKSFRIYNLWIDQDEINATFFFNPADNLKTKIQAFAQENKIQVVFQTLNQGTEICFFRYGKHLK
jgi:hypothetical protein